MNILKVIAFSSSVILGLYCINYLHWTWTLESKLIRSGSTSADGLENVSKNYGAVRINNALVQCEPEKNTVNTQKPSLLHLAMVVCDDRVTEALVSLKSVAIFTETDVHAHIYSDESASKNLTEQLNQWPVEVRIRFSYSLYRIKYPAGLNHRTWIAIHKPCATQRLFFPLLMKDVDSLVYLDTDTLLLTSLENVWKHFYSFNSKQLSGLAPEAEDSPTSWYTIYSITPYVQPYGVNSGVMLMNLTRMRDVHWTKSIVEYFDRYSTALKMGDQDLINIFFHFNPEKLFTLPCSWNFCLRHCQFASNTSKCYPALKDGANILHYGRLGNDRPAFNAVFKAFEQHMLNQTVENELLPRIKKNLLESNSSLCKEVSHVFTRQIEKNLYCDQQRILREKS